MLRTIGCLVLGLGLPLSLAGCGRSGGGPATVSASGVVLFQGKPVDGAHVSLAPQGAGGQAAFARTDAEGRFQLQSAHAKGVVPGSYGVTISKDTTEPGMTAEQAQARFEKTGQAPPPAKVTSHLPAKYKKTATSGLTATVKESGDNEFKFELTP